LQNTISPGDILFALLTIVSLFKERDIVKRFLRGAGVVEVQEATVKELRK